MNSSVLNQLMCTFVIVFTFSLCFRFGLLLSLICQMVYTLNGPGPEMPFSDYALTYTANLLLFFRLQLNWATQSKNLSPTNLKVNANPLIVFQ